MWIWVIIFLPIVGSIAYIFLEMLRGKNVSGINLSNIFQSKPSIKRLEENLRFSDTFNNRVMLADAYLESGMTERAIDLYESSLTGAFEENEYVHIQLVKAYYKTNQFDKVVCIAKKNIEPSYFSSLPTTYALCNGTRARRTARAGRKRVSKNAEPLFFL
jgi:hypothetical protein